METGKEKEVFLRILRDYINESASDIPDEFDHSLLISLSNAQQVSPIVYYQTNIPALQPAFACATYYAVNRRTQLETMDQEFRKSGIPYLIFKGSEVAQYYPHPHLRQSGDVDMLVRKEDKEKAGAVLEAIGFKGDGIKKADHEWIFEKGNFEIELHHRLLYDNILSSNALTSFTDAVWEHSLSTDGIFHHIEPEFHFVFLLLHLRKHFLWTGVGIRQFMDLAVMMKYAKIDWRKTEEYLMGIRLLPFAQTCFALTERWFGISCPIPSACISDDFFLSATDTILSGGAFGNMSRSVLMEHGVRSEIRKYGKILSFLTQTSHP